MQRPTDVVAVGLVRTAQKIMTFRNDRHARPDERSAAPVKPGAAAPLTGSLVGSYRADSDCHVDQDSAPAVDVPSAGHPAVPAVATFHCDGGATVTRDHYEHGSRTDHPFETASPGTGAVPSW